MKINIRYIIAGAFITLIIMIVLASLVLLYPGGVGSDSTSVWFTIGATP